MIELIDVSKTYSTGIPALNHINLHIKKGEFVFIVGSSGSGKSTLIKLLLKELEPTSGQIIINDKNIGRLRKSKIPYLRRDIGVVFQDFRLFEDRNVYENIAFAQKATEAPECCPCCQWWDFLINTRLIPNSFREENSSVWPLQEL